MRSYIKCTFFVVKVLSFGAVCVCRPLTLIRYLREIKAALTRARPLR
jgi:hypothetical protein